MATTEYERLIAEAIQGALDNELLDENAGTFISVRGYGENHLTVRVTDEWGVTLAEVNVEMREVRDDDESD